MTYENAAVAVAPLTGPARFAGPVLTTLGGMAGAAYAGLNDPFREQLFPKCFILHTTGLACPSCGATRATHLLLRGDVAGALEFNALLVLLVPVIIFGMVRWWIGAARGWTTVWTLPRAGLAIGLAFLWAVVRNLPFEPFAALNL